MQQDYIGASWGVRFNQREMKRMRSHIADALLEGAEPDPDGGFGSVVVDALDRFTPDGGKDLPIDLPAIEDDQYDIFGDWIEEMTKFTSIDEAVAHIKADHPKVAYLADSDLNGETVAQKLRALNSLHEKDHDPAKTSTAGPKKLAEMFLV